MQKWDAREAMRLIDRERITFFIGVPLMSLEIANHPARRLYDLSSCVGFAAGGSSRPAEHVSQLQTALPHAALLMGYGLTESLSFERPALVFRTGRYFLDQPAIREQQLQGIAIPNATLAALASCRITFWLIPKGEAPFSDRNSYSGRYLEPLYPPAFRQAFLAAHRRVEQTRYFDVWRCQPAARTR